MNFKQKLGYMFFGCLFTLVGYMVASLGGDTTHAEQNQQVVDKILCRELQVVNKSGKVVIQMSTSDNGGNLTVLNNTDRVVAGIWVGDNGGIMQTYNNAGKPVAGIGAGVFGGDMSLRNNAGRLLAGLQVANDQGIMEVYNKIGRKVVSISSTENGAGHIRTYNYKGGWRTH